MGADRRKDQSYFLFASPRAWLERLVFPLGGSTKEEVRAEAVARRLPGAGKGESQELCFVGDAPHAHARFVAERAPARIRPGAIVDETGAVLGSHDGVHRFTVGQRKGLGAAAAGRAQPVYVNRIDAETATVHVGSREALGRAHAEISDVFLSDGVTLPVRATVRVRYRDEGHTGVVSAAGGLGSARARVAFDSPVGGVAPGQVAVFYDGDQVLGGGRIVGYLTES
jgi:tRNA-specific 2-thiouridylase